MRPIRLRSISQPSARLSALTSFSELYSVQVFSILNTVQLRWKESDGELWKLLSITASWESDKG